MGWLAPMPANPNASEFFCMAAMQKAMWSSSGTPSSSAPLVMSSRLTPLAKALSFIFLRTPATSTSWMDFVGLTREQAVRNPASSSQAKRVFVEMRYARHAGVFGVTQDSGANLFGPTLFGEDLVADEGMLFLRWDIFRSRNRGAVRSWNIVRRSDPVIRR